MSRHSASIRTKVARSRRERSSGQALVIMALAILALVAGMGLIIDGGNAWAQQRIAQAGNDAAAEAGAIQLMDFEVDKSLTEAQVDANVLNAINASADSNGIEVTDAYYTDVCGVLLKPDGTRALSEGTAARVGTGGLPTNTHVIPDCPSGVVGPVQGVEALGRKQFGTFVSQVIGVKSLTANTRATAVEGLLQGCTASTGCVVLPVTVPVNITMCDHSGDPVPFVPPTVWEKNVTYIVPLCKGNPGSVGWLDWTPKGGGKAELVDSILHPNNPPIDLPSWHFMTETGNPNSKPIDDALNSYDGQVVMFPMFDRTCGSDPILGDVKVPPDFGCSDPGGSGSNQWYRIPRFASFLLDHAYVNGGDGAICNPTGQKGGPTSCLIGQYVDFATSGTVGPGIGGGSDDNGVRGVQLIK